MADPFRLRRSALYLPASNARAIEKARSLAADVIILDLEDAVAPDAKAQARTQAVEAAAGGFGNRELVIRVNGLDTPWGAEDIAAVAHSAADAVLVPKVASAASVADYARLLGDKPLWGMIETCEGVHNVIEIAKSGLKCLVFGINDLAKEMRARLTPDRAIFIPALAATVMAARAAGIAALDGVTNAIDDTEALALACDQAVAFGFDGKTLIHPAQIAACNSAFSPSAEDVAQARAIVEAFALPENADKGAIRVNGRMVERLHLSEAERVLLLDMAASEARSAS